MRLLRATLRKLVRRPASWVTLLLLMALLALIDFALIASSRVAQDPQQVLATRQFVTFPLAYELVLTLVLQIGGLLAVTYGAAIGGSEWTWGTLKAAVARGESRSRYALLTFAGVTVFIWIGLAITFVFGVLGSVLGAVVLNVPLTGLTDAEGLGRLPEAFARAGLALAMNGAFGFAIATVARSQLAGIAVGVGLFFAEGIASLFLPDVIKWFPLSASGAVTTASGSVSGGSGGNVVVTQLDPNTAVIVVAVWLLVALAVSAGWTERAEIGG